LRQRLRSAMMAASGQAPADLLERVRRRHRRRILRLSATCVGVVAAIALVVTVMTNPLDAESGPSKYAPAGVPAMPSGSVPGSTAAPGTLLLTCSDANWGQLSSVWRSESLEIGPLWLADARRLGYAHYGDARNTSRLTQQKSRPVERVMIAEVTYGARVVMKVPPSARSYFQFVRGFNQSSGNRLPRGDIGFTLVSCPRGTRPGPNGRVTDFNLGYVIEAGRVAAVDISAFTPKKRAVVAFS